ncbi:M23 family metallopeptidase [Gracilimonas sediminicola]|uniref:M23 family metallopeptidase n=1 Tax=Gracilimonas sediminicola TaxID=2952158 RepID=A0A9X2L100_9BACT|nr:M23 family metallopeptidase [Gracilimonas sediminicola]MCP9290285.1 M23 family metallopeptidase [Gracilimonas sediminicola]
MKSFWVILFLIAGLLSQDKGSVEVFRIEKEEHIELHARNTNLYPVTIELDADIDKLEPQKKLSLVDFLPANSNRLLVRFTYKDLKEGWNLNTRYRYYMGNIFARHNDSFAYRLPFPIGESYKVDQGFGGTFSHYGDSRHALDFNMPTGTEIYAARSGKVVMMEEKNNRGGGSEDMMPFANFITILHDDGTFADYSHLRHQGVEVRLGQEVRTGQLIGYSGATGYATGPHLHFTVKKAKRGGGFISIPVKFTTKDGIIELKEGQSYIGY